MHFFQIGCSLNCSFCSTGAQGYNRDLSIAEIIGQVYVAAKALQPANYECGDDGYGRTFIEFDNVVAAMDIMRDDFGYHISKYQQP